MLALNYILRRTSPVLQRVERRNGRRCKSTIVSTEQYCQDLVRKHDYEHFMSSLWLPADIRKSLFAIRAFNIEIAQIRDLTSETHMGRVRTQWYREAVNSIYEHGTNQSQPSLKALSSAISTHKLNKRWLERLIKEREKQLSESGFMSMDEVEDYCEGVNSSLFYLSLQCVGVADVHADHAASHLGKAEGIVTLLRGVAYHAMRRKVFLPMDQLMAVGLSQEDVIRRTNDKDLAEVAFTVAAQAHTHLETARGFAAEVPSKATRVLLPAVSAEMFLERLQMENFDLFSRKLSAPYPSLPFRLLRNAWSRTY
eukprot:CFRG2378T1